MTISEIQAYPRLRNRTELEDVLTSGASGIHQSLFRSYHIVAKVKQLAQRGIEPSLLLELIELMESRAGGAA